MDPFSQGFLGSLAAQVVTKKSFGKAKIFAASLCGLVGGVLPDADIFIKSDVDTLMTVEYHRHFTHALSFIPIGGLIAALLCYFIVKSIRKNLSFKQTYIFATLGYATHGLLDGATSYGTRLLWPFADERISWSIISIIDPLFTIPLILITIFSVLFVKPNLARYFCIFGALYFSLGYFQNQRVEKQMYILAEKRNHKIDHFELKPTIGNNILWRSTYRAGDKLYADAVRVTWLGDIKIYEGESADAVNFDEDFKSIDKASVLYNDISRFNFFSNDLLIRHNDHPKILIDGRYSLEATSTAPMWGIKIDLNNPDKRAIFTRFPRDITEGKKSRLVKMLWGEDI